MRIPNHTPDPVPEQWLRDLLATAGISQMEAARRLRYDPPSFREFFGGSSKRPCPWRIAELLRAHLAGQPPNLTAHSKSKDTP